MFVWWTTTTCEVRGKRFRKHTCEQCCAVYGYEMERVVRERASGLYGYGVEAARGRAKENADGALAVELAGGFDAVPCPNCGRYQSEMIAHERARHGRVLAIMQSACLFVCGLSVTLIVTSFTSEAKGDHIEISPRLTRLVLLVTAGLCAAGSVVARVTRTRCQNRINPNGTDATSRIAVAKQRGAVVVRPPVEPA